MISQKNTPSRLESHGAVPLLNPTTGIKMTFDSLPLSSQEVQLAPIGSSWHQEPKNKTPINLLSQERLRELFDYDQVNGDLIWKPRALSTFATEKSGKIWNTKYAGTIAGHLHKSGYVKVKFKKLYYAHRLIWLWCNGLLPQELTIDHINGNRSDNRINNLRLATFAQNQRNRAANKNNILGIKGVFWNKINKNWVARIAISGKCKHLGCFASIEDAAAAYAQASEEISKEFTHPSTKAHKRKSVQLEISVFQGDE